MRRRLALGAAAVTTTVALAFLVPLALVVRTVTEERAVARAELVARSLAPLVAVTDDAALVADAVAALSVPEALVVVHLPGVAPVGGPVSDDALVAEGRSGRAVVARDDGGATVVLPVAAAGAEPAVITVAVPAEALRRGVGRAWVLLAGLGAVLLLIAVGLADRLARSVVVPVRALADTTRRLAAGELDARVEPSGPPEIAEVGRAANRLAERIGVLLTRERELVADLSHRLRTPLAVLRLDAEQLGDGDAADRLRDDVDLLERGLGNLIREARRQPAGPPAVLDLGGLVRERTAFWAVLAEEQGRPWTVAVPAEPVPVAVDAEDAAAALDAVLANVFSHTSERTACRIALVAHAGAATLAVEDDGPGFRAGVAARGASGAGSTGLGLDIVRRAAEAAGGTLELGAADGSGARVVLVLPLTAAGTHP